MNKFNVLDRNCTIDDHTLIEASAGTGKTFSIGHLFVRLLLEEKAIGVGEIVVMTFTRKATAEIKARVRTFLYELERALTDDLELIDYVEEFVQKNSKESALERVRKALNTWDEVQIFTIHSLADRIVRVEQGIQSELIEDREQQQVIHDYLTHEIDENVISKSQLKRILKSHKSSVESLKSALICGVNRNVMYSKQESYVELFERFKALDWKKIPAEDLLGDYELQRPNYKAGKNKAEESSLVETFVEYLSSAVPTKEFFDFLIENGVIFTEIFSESNRKVKTVDVELRQEVYYKALESKLAPIINQARESGSILIQLIMMAKRSLENYKKIKRRHTYDDSLVELSKQIEQPELLESIRNSYKAVLIDEFQDTDPVQWKIFKEIFLEDPLKRSRIFLVGDPKQAIYAFRQSDIYTYLDAARALGEERRYSLDTNWRSKKRLIECLNHLFDPSAFAELIPLPRLSTALPITSVLSGDNEDKCETEAAVHFFHIDSPKKIPRKPVQEEGVLLERICSEIVSENANGKPFASWAILIRDTAQSDRVVAALKKSNIPFDCQKKASLCSSEGFRSMRTLVTLFREKADLATLKMLLGSKFFAWNRERLQTLVNSDELFSVSAIFETLQEVFLKEGFSLFFEKFILTSFSGLRPLDQLQKDEEFYAEVRQVVDLVSERQVKECLSSKALIKCFDEMERESQIRIVKPCFKDAVKVVTLHSSKGLEYDFVFPLGLICGNLGKEELIPIEDLWASSGENKEAFERYLEESDSEQMRLLYVAFTRAKKKLFIPLITSDKGEDLSPGKGSPLGIYLSNYKGPISFESFVNRPGFTWEELKSKPHYSCCVETSFSGYEKSIAVAEIQDDNIELNSFTSLTKNLEVEYPQFIPSIEKSSHTLPPGKLTGIILHKLFENANFKDLSESHLNSMMKQFVSKTALEGWESVLKEMLIAVSKTPLETPEKTFKLADVECESIKSEADFLFHQEGQSFIHGSIDFFCKHEGKYYLIDWKSNWLGPDSTYYHKEELAKQMQTHQYTLQAELYKEALKKYVAFFEEKPFEAVYGGTFYLFTRGVGVHYERSC